MMGLGIGLACVGCADACASGAEEPALFWVDGEQYAGTIELAVSEGDEQHPTEINVRTHLEPDSEVPGESAVILRGRDRGGIAAALLNRRPIDLEIGPAAWREVTVRQLVDGFDYLSTMGTARLDFTRRKALSGSFVADLREVRDRGEPRSIAVRFSGPLLLRCFTRDGNNDPAFRSAFCRPYKRLGHAY